MRTIEVSEVTRLVRQLCIDANYYLPADLRQAFVDGQNAEESPLGKTIFGEMIANCDLARENNVPVCQDTGMAIVFAEIGQDVHLTGGSFEDAVTEGVRRGYIDGYLRLSVVGDPLRRENTNDNTPCILYTSVVPGDKVKITVAPKGFGSENMTQMKMFTPAADLRQAFVDGQNAEESPLGKTIFGEMIANCDLARENNVPVCQDTGMAIVFAEIGQDVHLTGGSFEDAVTEGVRRGYIDGYLRLSVVGDPLRRENTNDNTPCILYTSVVPGDKVKITVAPKGFGSENMTQMKMFTPAATKAQIVDFIADACIHAGSNPCPPIVIGVGLGGTSDKAAYLAKRALLRPVDQHNADPLYAEMEQQILDKVNASGVGPQGLGGTVTALACAIEPFGTHIAGLPCVVNISCHVTRHAEGEL